MKKVFLILILAALGGGFWYYQHYTGSPEYSLKQAHEAMEKHDLTQFQKYVDVESVTGSLVDQLVEQKSLVGSLIPGNMVVKQALRLMKPQLTRVAGKEIEQYVQTGDFRDNPDTPRKKVDISLSGLWHKVVSDSAAFKGVKYVKEEGESALVGEEFTQPRYDTTLVVEMKMQDQGDHWKVVALTNTGDLLKHTSRLQRQRLGDRLNLR